MSATSFTSASASAAASSAAASGSDPGAVGASGGPLLPSSGELPPYTATQLGPERAVLARALRQRLIAAGISWPGWIDARPGRLQVILGDCSDPPLGATAAALVQRYGELVLDGIAGLGLITGVSRLVLCASAPATVAGLRALCAEQRVAVVATPAVYPACPESDVPDAGGHAYTVPAEQLVAIGALVRGLLAPRLCTVAGAVVHPQVIERRPGGRPADPLAAGDDTALLLVRRCGGAQVAAWVAVVGGALGGVLWPAEAPLPATASLCLILPVTHELVARLRRGDQWLQRARNACLSCRVCTDFCPGAQAGLPLFPHHLMRRLAGAPLSKDADGNFAATAQAAIACTGCGACSVMCPADLLPGAAMRALAATIAEGQGGAAAMAAHAPLPPGAGPPVGELRVPLPLLLARLGLGAYVRPV